jgi:hypothetical protein
MGSSIGATWVAPRQRGNLCWLKGTDGPYRRAGWATSLTFSVSVRPGWSAKLHLAVTAGDAEHFMDAGMLPARALEMAGHSSVPDGARVKVRISQGQKGPQVAEVLEVDASTAHVTSRAERRPASRPSSERPMCGTDRGVSEFS